MSSPFQKEQESDLLAPTKLVVFILCAIIIAYFFGVYGIYEKAHTWSALRMLVSNWSAEQRYEHGWLFPIIIIGILIYERKKISSSLAASDYKGLIFLCLGCLLYLASIRVIQWRITVGSMPFIISGCVWYLWGKRAALATAFPTFLIWLSVPMPNIQQATVPLQNISVKLSQIISSLFGIKTFASGATIFSLSKSWEPIEIAESCSGIRSLMALVMISTVWAYLSHMSLWKRMILIFAALPISIIGNALRISSIYVLAEMGHDQFARGTWHDQSGLLLFYPISLTLLMILHAMLEGYRPWKKKTVIRRNLTNESTPSA